MRNIKSSVCLSLALCAGMILPSPLSIGRPLPNGFRASLQDQKHPDENQSVKLKADLVEVHAVVTDRAGHPIDNLSKEDFELLENGKPQEISFFALERVGGESASPAGGPSKPTSPSASRRATGRVIVLFADNLHLSPTSLLAVKRQFTQFVDEQMSNRDTVLVLTSAGSLGTLQRFTSDRDILRQAIDKISSGMSQRDSAPSFTPYLAGQILQKNEPGRVNLQDEDVQQGLHILMIEEGYTPCNCKMDGDYVVHRASMILAAEAQRRRATLGTLKAICDRLAELPGQRLVAFASDGFTNFDESGTRDFLDMSAVTSRAALHGVVIYTFGAQGLAAPDASPVAGHQVMSSMADSRLEQQQIMRNLAAETGGEVFLNTNNLNKSLATMLANNSAYYTLSYYPPDDKDPKKVRTIAVRVKNHPEYSVRAQKGYLPSERKSADAAVTPQQKLFQAMISPVPSTTIDVTSSALFLEREDDNAQVTLHIDGGTVEYEKQADNYLLHCEVAGSVFDRDGKVADSFAESIKASLTPAELQQVRTAGYRYAHRLQLKPGLYDVRVGVMDSDGARIGTATTSLEIPDLTTGKLALSGIVLSPPSEEDPPIAMLLARISAGTPSFKSAASASYHLVVYNMSPDDQPETIDLDILRDGKTVQHTTKALAAKQSAGIENGIEIGGALSLSLPPGNYTLRVKVTKSRSKEAAEQTVDFQIDQ